MMNLGEIVLVVRGNGSFKLYKMYQNQYWEVFSDIKDLDQALLLRKVYLKGREDGIIKMSNEIDKWKNEKNCFEILKDKFKFKLDYSSNRLIFNCDHCGLIEVNDIIGHEVPFFELTDDESELFRGVLGDDRKFDVDPRKAE